MTTMAESVNDRELLGAVHDYGDQALLLDFDGTAEVLAWTDALREADLPGVLDIVPASRTVLLELAAPALSAADPAAASAGCTSTPVPSGPVDPRDRRADVTIDVVYDGEDLDEVARLTGTDAPTRSSRPTPPPRCASDSAASHRVSPTWSAVTSGCTYRAGPNRAPRCPPDRSALAGEFSGVYPRRVPRRLAADRPHRRGAVGRRPRSTGAAGPGHVGAVPGGRLTSMTATLEILATGPLALVEDLGRPGLANIGVTRSGRRRPSLPHAGQQAGRQPARPRHHRGDLRRILGAGARR